MKLRRIFTILLPVSLLLSGCGASAPAPTEEAVLPTLTEAVSVPETTPETLPPLSPEELLLSSMSLRERVGQLFIVRPDALDFSIPFGDLDNSRAEGKTALTEEMLAALQQYPVGGFVHFQKNIQSPEQIRQFNASLSAALSIPPFLSVDEEGGLVARLANSTGFQLPKYKSAAAVGKEGPEAALAMGQTIGGYLKDYGFQMDFAPVADVNTNPRNPVIGTRAFSSQPEETALLARSMADGLRMAGIAPVFKHFPGHGDTAEDSHSRLAVSHKTKEELLACEWIPFLQAEDRECIMAGHIALPEVTGNMVPASLSEEILTGILREELGFQGLIVTDSLSMGAITGEYSSGQAALKALEAGCDILLMPASLQEAFEAVVSAVEDGSYPEEDLNRSVLRILKAKLDYHILVTE